MQENVSLGVAQRRVLVLRISIGSYISDTDGAENHYVCNELYHNLGLTIDTQISKGQEGK